MSEEKFYVRGNLQIEPLFNNWYAYPLLIAPATAAMNIANMHRKIMKSYVAAPEVHAAAVKNPAMRGGPFMDFDRDRTAEVRALLQRMSGEQEHMLGLADSIKALNTMLLDEAKGHSLEGLYERVPERLRGYVELVYDINHQPSVRFIERLLYTSEYYDTSLQSVLLSLAHGDERPFVFSTPRLEDPESVHLRIPFAHPGIDELFRMRHVPQTFSHIKAALGFGDEYDERFRSFLTRERQTRPQRYAGEGVRVRYYGHACVLVETKDVSVLTDPVISYDYHSDFPRYTYADLPENIDYVLITHSHADHFMLEALLQLRHKIGQIVVPRNGGGALEDPSLRLILQSAGFKNVIEVDEMETIEVPGGGITALPFLGEHADLNIRTKTAHLIRLGGRSILCAADSSNLEPKLYEHVQRDIGDLDILFIGMECDGAPLSWVYGSLLSKPLDRKMDRSRKLSGSDFERGIEIVNRFNCGRVFVYAMGQEPWLCYVTSIVYTDDSKQIVESDKLVEECRARGIEAERLFGCKEIFLDCAQPALCASGS